MLKCAQCVKCVSKNNDNYNAEKSARGSGYLRLSFSDCLFEYQKKTICTNLILVVTTGRPELVFCIMYKTYAGSSDDVNCGDCRHDRDDEESH